MPLPTQRTLPIQDIQNYTYLVYGEPKVGKSTFASHFPDALFLATEAGHKFLSVYKVDIRNWEDLIQSVKELCTEQHQYKTVVIDTADNLYVMCARYICRKLGLDHESDADFGKGYSRIKQEFMASINALTQRGMGVVFISHVDTREVTTHQLVDLPDGGISMAEVKTKQTDATLSGSAKKVIRGMCDMIFYCYSDDNGDRWFRTKQTKDIIAGDRSGKLPPVMKLDYKELELKLKEGMNNEQ